MDSLSLRRLVEETAAQVLSERAAASGPPTPRPLILLTGTTAGLPVILYQLQRLQTEIGPATAVLSDSFRQLVTPESFTQDTGITQIPNLQTLPQAESLCATASLLLVAPLSDNSRAKIAAGITDSAPSLLWAAARAAGLPLFVAEPPETLVTPPFPALPPARLRQREEQMGILREDGAQVIPAAEIAARIQRHLIERADPAAAKRQREAGPRPIITVEDVERAHRRGLEHWDLPKNAIVTAAAWDRARDLGLELTGGNLPA